MASELLENKLPDCPSSGSKDFALKIPGTIVRTVVEAMDITQETIYRGWKTTADLGKPGETVLSTLLSPLEKRLDELATQDCLPPTTPLETMTRFYEIGFVTGATIFSKSIEAAWTPIKNAGKGSDLLLEAQTRELKGITPYEVVATDGFAQLRHYQSEGPACVFVFPPMNKPEILDISENRSFIQAMLAKNIDFYLITWGGDKLRSKQPGWEQEKNRTLDRNILTTIPEFVQKATQISGTKKIHIGSYCLGATLASMYLALQPKVQPDVEIESAFMLTPPLDFTQKGLNRLFEMSENPLIDIESVIESYQGIMPGTGVNWGALLRNPEKYILDANKGAMDIAGEQNEGKVAFWKQIAAWLAQPTDFPGPLWKRLFKEVFNENKLVRGELTLQSEDSKKHIVDLSQVKTPILQIIAEADDIVNVGHSRTENFPNSEVRREVKKDTAHVNIVLSGKKNGVYQDCADWVLSHST